MKTIKYYIDIGKENGVCCVVDNEWYSCFTIKTPNYEPSILTDTISEYNFTNFGNDEVKIILEFPSPVMMGRNNGHIMIRLCQFALDVTLEFCNLFHYHVTYLLANDWAKEKSGRIMTNKKRKETVKILCSQKLNEHEVDAYMMWYLTK